LERHVTGLSKWIDLAAQVFVVDSDSSDGTVDFLRERLRHPNLKFLTHPPGLYASWNFGISHIQTKYTIIATCGDTMSRSGAESFLSTMEQLQCDVLISRPIFEDSHGRPVSAPLWPIDDITACLELKGPARLTRAQSLIFIAANLPNAITGSCASCIFRTDVLQRFPFPTDVGAIGDCVWALRHALHISWGATPEVVSTFLKHPVELGNADRKQNISRKERLDLLLLESASEALASGLLTQSDLELLQWDAMQETLTRYWSAKSEFDRLRKSSVPWILRPSAWWSRIQRNTASARMQTLRTDALRRLHRLNFD